MVHIEPVDSLALRPFPLEYMPYWQISNILEESKLENFETWANPSNEVKGYENQVLLAVIPYYVAFFKITLYLLRFILIKNNIKNEVSYSKEGSTTGVWIAMYRKSDSIFT
ncbi:hypothetical protein O6H91_Y219700 [Diphasiastrum complanatum]|nr:hypothetical protein O6H91_Y219700 [Diphasiastrum complanatum]